jgi:hypothetical protein
MTNPIGAPVATSDRIVVRVILKREAKPAPESAWRIAAFCETGQLDTDLAAIAQVAAAYVEFLDFSIPSALTQRKDETYDGSHYMRAVNARVLAGLVTNQSDLAVDWRKEDLAAITALYHKRLAQSMDTTTETAAGHQARSGDPWCFSDRPNQFPFRPI